MLPTGASQLCWLLDQAELLHHCGSPNIAVLSFTVEKMNRMKIFNMQASFTFAPQPVKEIDPLALAMRHRSRLTSLILNYELVRATGASVHQYFTLNGITSLTTIVSIQMLPLQTTSITAVDPQCSSSLCSFPV